MRLSGEFLALIIAALVATIYAMGNAASCFAGTGFRESLLPFSSSVLILALAMSAFGWGWLKLRPRLRARREMLPPVMAGLIAGGAGTFATTDEFHRELRNLRTLVGGTEEAGRITIAHQVYAAYRRSDLVQRQRIIERALAYLPQIRQASVANGVDAEVMIGIGAAESSFLPRDSRDGGRGLFQITSPPRAAVAAVKSQLDTDKPDPLNHLHNAYLAAATFRHYLQEMNGDLFLGLLAYNIGPQNGGLRSIMRQYGARNFVTIQPYLQNLPRDYPIRVLSAALAYRIWRIDGKLLRYEDGKNAVHIQALGVPGLLEGRAFETAAARSSAHPAPVD